MIRELLTSYTWRKQPNDPYLWRIEGRSFGYYAGRAVFHMLQTSFVLAIRTNFRQFMREIESP